MERRCTIDKITLEDELASRAGRIRRLMTIARKKEPLAAEDKYTTLEYLKQLRKEAQSEDSDVTDLTVTFK